MKHKRGARQWERKCNTGTESNAVGNAGLGVAGGPGGEGGDGEDAGVQLLQPCQPRLFVSTAPPTRDAEGAWVGAQEAGSQLLQPVQPLPRVQVRIGDLQSPVSARGREEGGRR